jgi:hypothetical protein
MEIFAVIAMLFAWQTPSLLAGVLSLLKTAGNYGSIPFRILGQYLGLRPSTPMGQRAIAAVQRKWRALKGLALTFAAIELLLMIGIAIFVIREDKASGLALCIVMGVLNACLFFSIASVGNAVNSKKVWGEGLGNTAMFPLAFGFWFYCLGFEGWAGFTFVAIYAGIALGIKIRSTMHGESNMLAPTLHLGMIIVPIVLSAALTFFAADTRRTTAERDEYNKMQNLESLTVEQRAFNTYGKITEKGAVVVRLIRDKKGNVIEKGIVKSTNGENWVLGVNTEFRAHDSNRIPIVQAQGTYAPILLKIDGTDEYPLADPNPDNWNYINVEKTNLPALAKINNDNPKGFMTNLWPLVIGGIALVVLIVVSWVYAGRKRKIPAVVVTTTHGPVTVNTTAHAGAHPPHAHGHGDGWMPGAIIACVLIIVACLAIYLTYSNAPKKDTARWSEQTAPQFVGHIADPKDIRLFKMESNKDWQDVTQVPDNGSVTLAKANGWVKWDPKYSAVQYSGTDQPASKLAHWREFPLASAGLGALIVRIDDGPPFFMKVGSTQSFAKGGMLKVRSNDNFVDDNSGEINGEFEIK